MAMTASGEHGEGMRQFLERHECGDLPLEDLALALTHRSHAYESGASADNERLEFLGDALISAVTSEALYASAPDSDEGAMSKRRSRLISRAVLGRRAGEMGIGDIVLLGRGERESGGARRRSILGSTLEAIVAAIYLRLGFERVRRFVMEHVLASLLAAETREDLAEDYKSTLQEWSQQHYRVVPTYQPVAQTGPDHEKRFTISVNLRGQRLAEGVGRRIKSAENDAARVALQRIQNDPALLD
jgi:ribonuclease III